MQRFSALRILEAIHRDSRIDPLLDVAARVQAMIRNLVKQQTPTDEPLFLDILALNIVRGPPVAGVYSGGWPSIVSTWSHVP
jgi:hypothetical protein